jgi:hypothetical protein
MLFQALEENIIFLPDFYFVVTHRAAILINLPSQLVHR